MLERDCISFHFSLVINSPSYPYHCSESQPLLAAGSLDTALPLPLPCQSRRSLISHRLTFVLRGTFPKVECHAVTDHFMQTAVPPLLLLPLCGAEASVKGRIRNLIAFESSLNKSSVSVFLPELTSFPEFPRGRTDASSPDFGVHCLTHSLVGPSPPTRPQKELRTNHTSPFPTSYSQVFGRALWKSILCRKYKAQTHCQSLLDLPGFV
mmetsp:Transcript_3350/g.5243  ORF Transcript_3350/g.5243 Transcript_3350/m.5243 type:complete len:209 (-) Transcript_3350:62-688(-)